MSLAKGYYYTPLHSSVEHLLEKEPVVPEAEADERETVDRPSHLRRKTGVWSSVAPFAVHIIIFMVYSAVFAFVLSRNAYQRAEAGELSLLSSPAKGAIKVEKKLLHNDVLRKSPFKGPPSPEVDKAWHGLLENSNIRMSAGELQAMNRTSVSFADGSPGYLGTLDVFHQLHCLKYIRHYIHRDYYKIFKTNVPSEDHVDHCIDSLRQYVMCRADPAIQTYSWIPTLRIPWANFNTEHDCVNWDALNGWAKERSVDIYDPALLVHPSLGPSFPPGWYEAQSVEGDGP